MANIDASIYSMVKTPQFQGPLDQYAQAMQVKNMIGGGQLQDLQLRQAQQSAEEDAAVRAAYGRLQPGQTVRDILPDVMRASPKTGLALQKQLTDSDKAAADLEKVKAETHGIQIKQLRDELAGVADDVALARLREKTMKLYGPSATQGMPQSVNDPAFGQWRQQNLMTADELLKRISPQLNMTDLGGTVQPTHPYTGASVGPGIQKTAPPQPPQGATWDSERGVWVQPPARGSMQPGTATPPPVGLPPRTGDVASLRKEFNDLPEVKNYRAVVPIINSAVDAPDTRAGDIQFAYTIGKIFDPNSVVREGELKLVGEAATIMQKYLGELQTITQGKGRLTEQTRQELLQSAMARVNELDAAQKAARATYENTAKARNLPVAEIFVDMPKVKTRTPKPAAPAAPGGPSRGITFLGFE